MPVSATQTSSTTRTRHCDVGDNTPPPQPNIDRALAFSKAPKGSVIVPQWSGMPSRGGRDPLYIELSNVEVGTSFEVINLSKKPGATFKRDAVALAPTGRDVQGRRAAIYLSENKMKELGFAAGDVIAIRAKDAAGNVSPESRAQIDPTGWGNQQVRDLKGNVAAGAALFLLDGENRQKSLIALAVPDSRPPVVNSSALKISKAGEISLTGALEPFASVAILNQRTGLASNTSVATDGTCTLALSDLKAGDVLTLSPTDASGVAGKALQLVFAPKSRNGIAACRNALGARLPGAIP